jgi:hypothetical protein
MNEDLWHWFTTGWGAFYLPAFFIWIFGRPHGVYARFFPKLQRALYAPSAELHPFMPVIFLINLALITWGEPLGGKTISYAVACMNLYLWWTDKDDDDRWRKRRKKLADKIRVTGGKLTVAPGNAS